MVKLVGFLVEINNLSDILRMILNILFKQGVRGHLKNQCHFDELKRPVRSVRRNLIRDVHALFGKRIRFLPALVAAQPLLVRNDIERKAYSPSAWRSSRLSFSNSLSMRST